MHHRPLHLPTAFALLSLAVSVASFNAHATSPVAQNPGPGAGEQQTQYRFNIPAQSLAASLSALARSVDVQLSLEASLVEGRQAPALSGTYSLADGLRVLLGEHPIDWTLTPQRTLILMRRADSATLNLDVTTIAGLRDGEVASGPVSAYRATRSATATKTDTALRDIPQSIQVVSREVLDDQKVSRLSDALSNVSSVQPSSSRGGATDTFVVRGFRATSYAVDGVMTNPLAERPEVQRDLANIERVEVLKGPASVLYGRGDPGGLINMVTRRPTFEPEGRVQLEAGTHDFYRLATDVSGALNPQESLAGRLTIATQTDAGARNTFRNSDRTFIAPSLFWQASEDTRVNLDLEYTHQSGQFDRGLVAANGKVNLPADQFLAEPWSRQTASKTAATLRVEHDVNDWLTLRQVARLDDSHNDRYSVDPRSLRANNRTLTRRVTDSTEDINTFDSQSEAILHLQTGTLQHTVLAGFEYVHGRLEVNADRANIADIDIYNPVYGAQPGEFRFNDKAKNRADLYSFYLQDQITLTEQWKLLIGARYDQTRQVNESTNADFEMTRRAIDSQKVTPRLGLVYQPRDGVSLYASYSTSFRPQTSVSQSGAVLDPETGVQYEIGTKLALIPDRLSATLAAFELTRKNVAATDPDDVDFSVQTGEQRVRGLELDVTGTPLPGWRIIGNASWLDAQITQDTTIEEGNRLIGVPRLSGALWSTYQWQDGDLKGLGFGAGVIAVGEREGNLQNDFDVSGYTRLDASVFYDINDQTRVALNGRNLTGRKYIETVSEATEIYAGAPTQLIASLTVKF